MTKYPRIYLAMDNCVFYKRWTTPDEWAGKMAGLGIYCIEASADTELDPAYLGAEYLSGWVDDVREAEAKHGVRVANLYSGHGSYTTLGMAHPDPRARDSLFERFLHPLIRTAGQLGCGMGFFAHAFPHAMLQSPSRYAEGVEIVTRELVRVAQCAADEGCGSIGLEKMYTPHQYPWRNADTESLLRAVKARSGQNFYFTEDLGHHHNRFFYPDAEARKGGRGAWLGTDKAYALAAAGEDPSAEIAANPQLFAEESDGDCYETLRRLGCYSPIVHLQQTDGTFSEHRPFTEAENRRGRIDGARVLRALKESYDRAELPDMPERCEKLYLTLELFSGTTSIMRDVLDDCAASVAYWRRFVPRDGMRLDELTGDCQ